MGTNVRRNLTMLVAAAVVATAACGSTSGANQAQELWEDYQAAIDSGDVESAAGLVSEDFTWVNPAMNDRVDGQTGWEQMLTWVVRVTDTDRTTLVDQFVSDDGTRVVWSQEWIGTTDLGADFVLHPTHVYTVDGGQFVSGTILFADDDAVEQIMATG